MLLEDNGWFVRHPSLQLCCEYLQEVSSVLYLMLGPTCPLDESGSMPETLQVSSSRSREKMRLQFQLCNLYLKRIN